MDGLEKVAKRFSSEWVGQGCVYNVKVWRICVGGFKRGGERNTLVGGVRSVSFCVLEGGGWPE